jgi:hypothetical protein
MAKKAQWNDSDLVTVDTSAIEQKMQDLQMTQPEIRKSLKSAIRQSLNIVRSGVRKGAATVTSNREKRQKGVGLVVYKNGSGGQVNIYNVFKLKNATGRGIFTLRWLEKGTRDVIGRDGRKHGATPAKPFFESSVSSVIGTAESKLSDNILQTIEKVASKRK